jgi:hypothetical protein
MIALGERLDMTEKLGPALGWQPKARSARE